MWGGSYFGYTQWVLADQVEPGPSALLIRIRSTDFHGMFCPGGAFSFESGLYWALGDHGKQNKAPSQAMLQRGYDGLSLIEADDRAVKDISFFNDWVSIGSAINIGPRSMDMIVLGPWRLPCT